MRIDAVAFDAYGTLFDVHSVRKATDELFPGKGEAISEVWRLKQLQYTWLRSLMGRYEDFWSVTRAALVFALKSLKVGDDDATVDRLLDEYLRLDTFPEVHQALEALQGRKLVILSNGSPAMLEAVVRHSGLDRLLDQVISVDAVKIYKPSAQSYQVACDKLGLAAENMLMVSSNAFDAQGAKNFGYKVAWIKRTHGQLEELGIEPDFVVAKLTDLPALIQ